MKLKIHKTLINGAIILFCSLFFGIAGLIARAYIGGNFLADFTFNGVRGYEAVGQIDFFAGLVIGVALGIALMRMHFKSR